MDTTPNLSPVATMLLAVLLLLPAIAMLAVFVLAFRPWFQAFLSGTPVTVFDVLGMRFRRIDVHAVLKAMIMAKHAGVPLTCRQAQLAALQGVDLEKLTLAMLRAKKEGQDVKFEELVAAELEARLADKLGERPGTAAGAAAAHASGGTAVEASGRPVRTCRKCSAQVTDDSKICRNCGAILP